MRVWNSFGSEAHDSEQLQISPVDRYQVLAGRDGSRGGKTWKQLPWWNRREKHSSIAPLHQVARILHHMEGQQTFVLEHLRRHRVAGESESPARSFHRSCGAEAVVTGEEETLRRSSEDPPTVAPPHLRAAEEQEASGEQNGRLGSRKS
ncbi:hypothetical protein H920_14146 [Fukomys damarensis]|uniref:Uncharacterized protein n=1 Tax=Fukomys damarensis TaxID=885580 RepID=A0A091D2J9_FUKDA|nr:hypothetical protein H920_14146 [Fukomys damarensis]